MAKIAGATDDLPHVVDVAVAIIRRPSELLICRRNSDAVLGGLWEFPGGKVENAESAPDCAIRETREELGIEIRADEILPALTHSYAHGVVRLTPVLCTYLSNDPKPLGCSEWKWVRLNELPAYAFPPANAPLVLDLIKRLA